MLVFDTSLSKDACLVGRCVIFYFWLFLQNQSGN